MNRKFSLQNRNRTEILLFGMYIVTLKSGVVDVEPYNIIIYWSVYIIDTIQIIIIVVIQQRDIKKLPVDKSEN